MFMTGNLRLFSQRKHLQKRQKNFQTIFHTVNLETRRLIFKHWFAVPTIGESFRSREIMRLFSGILPSESSVIVIFLRHFLEDLSKMTKFQKIGCFNFISAPTKPSEQHRGVWIAPPWVKMKFWRKSDEKTHRKLLLLREDVEISAQSSHCFLEVYIGNVRLNFCKLLCSTRRNIKSMNQLRSQKNFRTCAAFNSELFFGFRDACKENGAPIN